MLRREKEFALPCHFFTEYPEYRIAEYRENAFDFSGYPDVLNKLQNAYHTKNESCRECGARFTCTTCAANMIIKKNIDISKLDNISENLKQLDNILNNEIPKIISNIVNDDNLKEYNLTQKSTLYYNEKIKPE